MATYEGIGEIPLVAGHPALDLLNTVEPGGPPGDRGEARDHLARPGDLLVWARRAGLLDEAEARAEARAWAADPDGDLGRASLVQVTVLREAIHRLLWPRSQGAPTSGRHEEDLMRVQAAWTDAARRSRLWVTPDGPAALALVVGAEPGRCVLDRVAEAAVDLLTQVDLGPLRACPPSEGGCGWLFLDRSRGRTRRWCVMADCGARAKARRLNDRRRAARAARRGEG